MRCLKGGVTVGYGQQEGGPFAGQNSGPRRGASEQRAAVPGGQSPGWQTVNNRKNAGQGKHGTAWVERQSGPAGWLAGKKAAAAWLLDQKSQ